MEYYGGGMMVLSSLLKISGAIVLSMVRHEIVPARYRFLRIHKPQANGRVSHEVDALAEA